MEIIYIIIGAYVAWLLIRVTMRKKEPVISGQEQSVDFANITEERLYEIQTRFEKHLEDTFLPDALSGKEIYIYSHLICPWYAKLSSSNRYDRKMTQQLRNDLVDYISSLGDRSTYNFLSLEADDEKVADEYREKHIIASRKVFAIEDAFAAAIGQEASRELARIREIDFFRFDINGNLAPEGSTFGLDGKLHKE